MAIKKSLLVTGVIASIGLASLGVIGSVAANPDASGLAEKIAQRFNINQDEVQQVLDEHRDEKKAEHHEEIEDRLGKAVEEGKITEEQKSKILAKLDELKQEREANKDKVKEMSKEERRDFMKENRESLEAWAEENGISSDVLHDLLPHHRHGGPGLR